MVVGPDQRNIKNVHREDASTALAEGVRIFSSDTRKCIHRRGEHCFSYWKRRIWSQTSQLKRPISGSAGKNRKPPSTTRFLTTKPQVAKDPKRRLVGRSRVFPALPESQNGSMRQIPEPPSTPPFSRKETAGRCVTAFPYGRQVPDLPHTSECIRSPAVEIAQGPGCISPSNSKHIGIVLAIVC